MKIVRGSGGKEGTPERKIYEHERNIRRNIS
jgi:hypothetical protein